MSRNSTLGLLCALVSCLWSGLVAAGPTPVGPSEPVELGVWHSNLAAATAKAKELKVPMLVLWGSPECSHCRAFDVQLDLPEFQDYLANRGLVMVYEKTTDTTTDVKKWVGRGDYPLVRITWWTDSGTSYRVDYKWQYPKTYAGFRDVLESQISAYVPGPSDTSKDAYDDANDTAAGAPELSWKDQATTETLKLATKADAPVYADKEDWFKFAVVTGKTYKIWVTAVTGVSADAPKIAVFGDAAGTVVVGEEKALASGSYEFASTFTGTIYVRVKRATSSDALIQYALNYQRWAPGLVEFTTASRTISESSETLTLTVRRVNGTTGPVSVRVGFADSATPGTGFTATYGSDFTGTERVLSWVDGSSSSQSFSVTVKNEKSVWEGNETFGVTLAAEGSPAPEVGPTCVVTILEESGMTIPAGAYSGWVGSIYSNGVKGTFAMTVSAQGTISGKAVFPKGASPYSGTYTLTAMAYETISNGVAWLSGALKQTGSENVPLSMQVTLESGTVLGRVGTGESEELFELYLDKWALADRAALAAQYQGYYTVAFPVVTPWPDDAPAGAGYALLTVDARGRFKAAGKLGDGTSYTQSGVLFLKPTADASETNVCALLYSAPVTYKGGLFAGVVCFSDANTNGLKEVSVFDNSVFGWDNWSPFAVPVYDDEEPGFETALTAVGGWYNKLANLATYYQNKTLTVGDLAEPPALSYILSVKTLDDSDRAVTERTTEEALATSWQAVTNDLVVTPKVDGSGFTVPGADLKLLGKDADGTPIYNYDTAVNPNGLNVVFNRATGVISGKFKVYYDYATAIDATGTEELVTKWMHTSKQISYQAVLLPERYDLADEVEGAGYYLFPATSTYETATSTRSYSFNYSFEFLLTGSDD